MSKIHRPHREPGDALSHPDREELDDAILTARQNYDASVANTERLASESIVMIRRLGVAIARREAALKTLTRLEQQR